MPKEEKTVQENKWTAENVFKLRKTVPRGVFREAANNLNMSFQKVYKEFSTYKVNADYNQEIMNEVVKIMEERGIHVDLVRVA